MIRVTEADGGNQKEWESYLQQRCVDHHCFSWLWHDIWQDVFSLRSYYLLAYQNSSAQTEDQTNQVVGILPLVHMKSLLFGSALISVPYLNGGGILADTAEAHTALLDHARALGSKLDVKYIELRHRAPLLDRAGSLAVRSHKVSMLLDLPPSPEDLFHAFPPKLRSQIRRPGKSGIYAEVCSGAEEHSHALTAFYSVFAAHMRDLGTPVYPKKLFSSAVSRFAKRCHIITVWRDKRPVAAGITIGQGTSTEILWAASLRRYNRESPNMLLYWEAIKSSALNGYTVFDFGRSSYDTGTHHFKEQWGGKTLPLHWYYHLFKGELPDVSPDNPRYSFFVSCWKHFPLALTNRLGPFITRSLP